MKWGNFLKIIAIEETMNFSSFQTIIYFKFLVWWSFMAREAIKNLTVLIIQINIKITWKKLHYIDIHIVTILVKYLSYLFRFVLKMYVLMMDIITLFIQWIKDRGRNIFLKWKLFTKKNLNFWVKF